MKRVPVVVSASPRYSSIEVGFGQNSYWRYQPVNQIWSVAGCDVCVRCSVLGLSLCLLVMVLLLGCQNENTGAVQSAAEYETSEDEDIHLPSTIGLIYERAELRPLHVTDDYADWHKQDSMQFGGISWEPVTIDLYLENGDSPSFSGILSSEANPI